MRHNRARSAAEAALIVYFNKKMLPTPEETLGAIVSEILKERVQLSRMTICSKLLGKIEMATDEDEIAHYNSLIALFFDR
ncbi:two-component-system connector protein YcgZ [Enterobacter sp. JGM127]|nr:two-component-system connector protein YcgZ [Enterobacter sp. JGM127]